ncbi:DUF397 domain-containing protein [Streptomyces sp. NPDC049837]|uniref:DUF397 domain-containing protein n=1 Tax=Streptomyces sp. NPDC049837 TaxID=3155277 RepID=UPI00342CBC4C
MHRRTRTAREPQDLRRYSGGDGDDCVEAAACPSTVHVRDSKAQDGPQLALPPTAWSSFVQFTVAR